MGISFKRHFYLMCILPGLGDFRSAPPVHKQELLTIVGDAEGPSELVQAILLSDDLLQREAILAGEHEPDASDLAIISLQQVRNEAPLPHFMKSKPDDTNESSGNRISVDPIWQNYFRYACKIARIYQTPFLKAWVGFEVGMRNALARARAAALDLDPWPYLVAQELGDPESTFERIVPDWTAASNPLEALEILDRFRWNWATNHERWYKFSNDEVAAYTAKLMILHRWQRITEGIKNKPV